MMEHRGVITISPELLMKKLRLKGVTILDIKVDHFGRSGISIALAGEKMPECDEGFIPLSIRYEDIT